MIRVVLLSALALSAAGCSSINDRFGFGQNPEVFDGQRYRTAAKSERGNRASFVATARPVSASLDGAIEAARYESIQHCIRYFGTSDIDWASGPDTPREALQIEDDTLTFVGTCLDI
ncbi:hypothetical protein [Pacificoceanicola onchidii]|uniref:hypothetical protein n=1 Tax=Pacificoceanicola onchidii TaxID=2562685 RepID=UPI0010A54A73|nr:hypothetical protein [Pacificoceanicola onchidii]